jgi:CDP-glucose 4,6-dehydratase
MLTLDSSKAHARLGWRPRLTTEQAIAMTASWYRAFADGAEDMRSLTTGQIASFAASAQLSSRVQEKIQACA